MNRCAVLILSTFVLLSCVSLPLTTTNEIVNRSKEVFIGNEITILSLNMLHGFSDSENDATLDLRLELLIREVAKLSPDIILLQEASVTSPRRHGNVVDRLVLGLNSRNRNEYSSLFFPTHGSRLIGFYEGSAIVSRFSIADAELYRYSSQSLFPPEARAALRASIDSREIPISVVSTHLTNRDSIRHGRSILELQAFELAGKLVEWSRGGLLIVAGDFNAVPGSAPIQLITESGAVDTWPEFLEKRKVLEPETDGTSLRGGVLDTGSVWGGRIDYVFLYTAPGSAEVEITDARQLFKEYYLFEGTPIWISDHAGLMVRIKF